jgi:hypothetical protein
MVLERHRKRLANSNDKSDQGVVLTSACILFVEFKSSKLSIRECEPSNVATNEFCLIVSAWKPPLRLFQNSTSSIRKFLQRVGKEVILRRSSRHWNELQKLEIDQSPREIGHTF